MLLSFSWGLNAQVQTVTADSEVISLAIGSDVGRVVWTATGTGKGLDIKLITVEEKQKIYMCYVALEKFHYAEVHENNKYSPKKHTHKGIRLLV